MRSRLLAACVAGTLALTALAGCTTSPSTPSGTGSGTGSGAGSSGAGSASGSPRATQSVPAGLERFYTQQLTWEDCVTDAKCAQLTVPLDYAQPDGATIHIAVLKVEASRPGQRKGSLVVNPGGPGGSGTQYAAYADYIVGPGVRKAYDVVGFDPRGVGDSEPINCLNDAELDTFLGSDPTPDDAAEVTTFAQTAKGFADSCAKNAGPLLAHVSTREAAQDMDVLRAALGEETLTYLGKSYGTYLGAVYAGLFPQRVGRFVLDGVVAPDLTAAEINLGQAEGFERATRAWAAACVKKGGCPLGGSVDEVMQGLRDLLARLDQHPLAKTGDTAVRQLTEGWAGIGIAAAMYSPQKWDTLTDALRLAKAGDGSGLMDLADSYADRRKNGGYEGNLMEVIYAVNCLDKPEPASLEEHARLADEATAKAPTWGRFLMWSSLVCASWPFPAKDAPAKITAQGSAPIVVVGTTRDPATPYEWSVRLRDQLANASLITYDGDGHTAYTSSNRCVDDAIDAYYLDGTVPKDGLRC